MRRDAHELVEDDRLLLLEGAQEDEPLVLRRGLEGAAQIGA
jgi:hypothetical protein